MTTIEAGEGYRLLEAHETIREGDEWDDDGEWVPTENPGIKAGAVPSICYRRRLDRDVKPEPTPPAAERPPRPHRRGSRWAVDELDLDAIEERANAAKPGPWHYLHGYGFDWHPSGDGPSTPNVVFACRAREDVPALVAEVRRLRAERRAVDAVLEETGCSCDCDHSFEEHDDDCDRCVGCLISLARGDQ